MRCDEYDLGIGTVAFGGSLSNQAAQYGCIVDGKAGERVTSDLPGDPIRSDVSELLIGSHTFVKIAIIQP